MNPTGPLQQYGARLPKRDSDAEFLDDNIYAPDPGYPGEPAPEGLLDRLYREKYGAQPVRGQGLSNSVPTTKNRYA